MKEEIKQPILHFFSAGPSIHQHGYKASLEQFETKGWTEKC